jgi:hypothetical protein
MKLRPYHNPEKVDESRVPDGWRFLYADEAGTKQDKPCRVWLPKCCEPPSGFHERTDFIGDHPGITYIVPVNT